MLSCGDAHLLKLWGLSYEVITIVADATIIAIDHGISSESGNTRQPFFDEQKMFRKWTENVNSFPENIQFYIIFEIRVFSHFRLQSEKFPQIRIFPFEKYARKMK